MARSIRAPAPALGRKRLFRTPAPLFFFRERVLERADRAPAGVRLALEVVHPGLHFAPVDALVGQVPVEVVERPLGFPRRPREVVVPVAERL